MLHEIPAWLRRAKYRTNRVVDSMLATLFFPLARRVMDAYLRRGPSASTTDVMSLVAALTSATGGGSSIYWRLEAWLKNERAACRWRPDDPESVEDLTKHALSELRTWIDDHPDEDPRDETVIGDIAYSYVPAYNYDRLRVAMESSLWLIAGELDESASSVAELLGIAISEYIADELYEEADRLMTDREVTAVV